MKLSIVIPAYNEENRIIEPLSEYYEFFSKKMPNDFEIIIIPNNCKDNTLEVVSNFAKTRKNIKVHNIPYYVGKGGAVMQGFKLAKGDLIGFIDADKSTDSKNFFKIVGNIGNADGIIASRKIKGAKIVPKRNLEQNFSSFLFNKVTNILFNLKFKDTQCGAKLFKKETVKFLTKKSTEDGWGFDVDLLYLCKKKNLKIKEHPITWTDADGSHITILDGIKAVAKLFSYRFKL